MAYSVPVEIAPRTCATRLRVRCHRDEAPYQLARHNLEESHGDLMAQCDYHGHLDGPLGSWPCLVFPEASPERLEIAAYCAQMSYVYDDIGESLPLTEANNAYEPVVSGFRSGASENHNLNLQRTRFSGCVNRVKAIDPQFADKLCGIVAREFETFDVNNEVFTSLEDYFPYRYRAGLASMIALARFCIDIHLTPEEEESIQELETLTCWLVIFWNDYHSYEREKSECTRRGPSIARMRNAIIVLMSQHLIEEGTAKSLLRGLIVDTEEKFLAEKKRLEEKYDLQNGDLLRYTDGLEYLAGGNALWDATCPRYQQF